MRRFFYLAALVLLTTLLPELYARAEGVAHKAVAGPFQVSQGGSAPSGAPLVEVTFSNGKTGLFVVDTGAFECVITRSSAKRLGYKLDRNPLDPINPFTAHITDMRIGRLQVSDITFLAMPGTIGAENGRAIDGLLGGTLLSRFAVLLDYPHRTISWIYPGNLDASTAAALGFDPKSVIGMTQEEHVGLGFKVNNYGTRVQLQSGRKQWGETLFFDTGASDTSISAESAQRLGLVSAGNQPYDYVFKSPDSADKSVVPQFHIGPYSFSDVSVIYPSHSNSYMVSLIGANVLGDCRVLFDFGPHRCYLQPVLPGVASGPLAPLDTSRIDWERLRNAPEPFSFEEMIQAVEVPELLEALPAEVTRLTASSAGTKDAERCGRIGELLHEMGHDPEAKPAFEQAVSLRRADAIAHPEDPERAARYTDALISDAKTETALAEAQKNTVRWPNSPAVWCALGAAQETHAASLLIDGPIKSAADDEALDPSPDDSEAPTSSGTNSSDSEKKLVKPDPAHAGQIAALRLSARGSFDKAVALAPQAPDCYRRRARYWRIDRFLLSVLNGLGIKGQSPSTETALAAEYADYRREADLTPDDAVAVTRVFVIDNSDSEYRDDKWYQKQLRGTSQAAELKPGTLMTEKSALAHLTSLSESADVKVAAGALEALGAIQMSQGDPLAEATLRRALVRDPSRHGALRTLAALLLADNRPGALADVLLKCFDSKADLQSDSPALCLLLSEALSAVGQTATAEEQARAALKTLPDSPEANMALARLLLARSGDDPSVLPEAGACLTAAETGLGAFASPDQKAALQTLQAVRLALSGDPGTARTSLLQILHDRPTCTQARETLYALSVPPSTP